MDFSVMFCMRVKYVRVFICFCIGGQLRTAHLLAQKNQTHDSGTFSCRDLEFALTHRTKHTHTCIHKMSAAGGGGVCGSFPGQLSVHIGWSRVFLRGVLQPCDRFCPATLLSEGDDGIPGRVGGEEWEWE